ncbi:MAG TPA: DUF2975 domain-containing protein [Burkholderiaceae bacterium]|nr:DUF2975 domain-containing protein [Burkholderiaceae bacterium]
MIQLINSAFERHAMQRTSSWLAAACLLLMVVLPGVVFAFWALADVGLLAVRANLLPSAIQAPLQDWQRWAGAVVTGVPVVLMLLGLWQARQCLLQFAQGRVFTGQAVQRLRAFAAWALAAIVADMLTSPVLSVMLTMHNPPAARHLAIGIGTDHVLSALFAAMVWSMAQVIAQGQMLAEENASFV